MMNILFAVMAIALTCLVTFGGLNYINHDAPTIAVTTRSLTAQYEVIISGVTSYRMVNNGITPDSVKRFEGFLPSGKVPGFGAGDDGYTWTVEAPQGESAPVICLSVTDAVDFRMASVKQLAVEIERRGRGKVFIGPSCGEGVPHSEVPSADRNQNIVLTIRNF